MPELPEVETVVKGLRPLITDKIVTAVEIREENMIAYPEANVEAFRNSLVGSKIEVTTTDTFAFSILTINPIF